MLEVLAAVISIQAVQERVPPFVTMFMDNTAGRAALENVFGKDPSINSIITSFWSMVSDRQLFPAMRYVRSALNISDPVSMKRRNKDGRSWQWTLSPCYRPL